MLPAVIFEHPFDRDRIAFVEQEWLGEMLRRSFAKLARLARQERMRREATN